MKWTNDRADNVDDRRGSGGGGMLVGGGLGTLIIAAIIFFLGGDPSAILSNGVGNAPQTEQRELTGRLFFAISNVFLHNVIVFGVGFILQ